MVGDTQVKCLILPLQQGVLLVPNAVVAEVLNNQALRSPPVSAPAWQLGQIEWREEPELRVVSFEGICGDTLPIVKAEANVVVMHSIDPQQKTRYYGIYIDNVPSFEFVDNTTLTLASDQSSNADYVASKVFVNGIEGYVPDLDELAGLLG